MHLYVVNSIIRPYGLEKEAYTDIPVSFAPPLDPWDLIEWMLFTPVA